MESEFQTAVIYLIAIVVIGGLYLLFGTIVFDLIVFCTIYGIIISEKIKHDAKKKK